MVVEANKEYCWLLLESILLDEDLQPLWPREQHTHDNRKKHMLPLASPIPSSHDPTFSPPLKRKKDPLPLSDRTAKSQRMTDHLTARLATTLYVSSSMNPHNSNHIHQTGMENIRGFHRVQEQIDSHHHTAVHDSTDRTSEPRKYRKPGRNRSNPTTPVHSHPPSPGVISISGNEGLFPPSSSISNSNMIPHNTPSSRQAFESFARNNIPSNISLDPASTSQPSSLLIRRENRSRQHPIRPSAHQHLAMATRLALFHRIVSTTKSVSAQTIDMEIWIAEQIVKRGFPDRSSFEAAMTSQTQALNAALSSLGEGFSRRLQLLASAHRSQDQEIVVYSHIQTVVDAILETAHSLCGSDFDMSVSRICPQWSLHEGSIEQIIHYVQAVESIREILSDQFQHPQDLAEDLARSQEVIDYQRNLFGEVLRNNGLTWRALGLPSMEEHLQRTQEWILNLAKTLTFKVQAEVQFANESALHRHATLDSYRNAVMDEEEIDSIMGRPVSELMELVLQGAILSESCLELSGKRCPILVTAWMELACQYCAYALAKQNEHVLKANQARSVENIKNEDFKSTGSRPQTQYPQIHHHLQSKMTRGAILKTMELFESVNRLLQCVMEMRESEEPDSLSLGALTSGPNTSGDLEDLQAFHGASTASSDQDDAMDFVSTSSSSGSFSYEQGFQQQHQQQEQSRPQQRRSPMEPALLKRLITVESLASVLVEMGLELCESMAEILGYRYHKASSKSSLNGAVVPNSLPSPSLGATSSSGIALLSHDGHPAAATTIPSSIRAAAALSSLTTFAGGRAMVSGTGGLGLIFVQFVIRLLSKIIEFAGLDSTQEHRLLRIHVSLQNLEHALSS
ncbi:hypothetical protein BCR41DRAFT_17531 [Lobosporangium transversale]|uniref:Uncharacterized protein n=1 Tax=Lobosporangium transversale TaxID=64571 RepID=A0A1Y2GTR5_9FUNG|nr:hypothetical protein BCR41DRAFT_17531 [Lobosporangium transversale]ORZ22899.1 hypothetical protein BCR41DRAFT_17531 [Lobosporangium transversale]|eukprot:XP_021883453.1 hypothetical protein BCR41DRAFT_17531 [Lobosporangium transversale]